MTKGLTLDEFKINSVRLYEAISQRDLTPSQLATLSGLSKNTIYRILNHHHSPSYQFIIITKKCLQLTDEELINIYFKGVME